MTTPLLPEWVETIRKKAESATEGPWKIGYDDGSGRFDPDQGKFCLVSVPKEINSDISGDIGCVLHARLCEWLGDANFIASARSDVPRLIEALTIAMGALDIVGGGEERLKEHAWLELSGEMDPYDGFESSARARHTLKVIRELK